MPADLKRKITIKEVVGKIDIRALFAHDQANPGKPLDLMILRGVARRYQPGMSDKGDFVRFLGSFRATNMQTGEEINAPQMIMPPTIQDMVYAALGENADRDVAFALKVGVIFDDTAVTKYRYTFQSFMAPGADDPLSRMDAQLAGVLQSLPKPAQAAIAGPAVTDPTADKGASQAVQQPAQLPAGTVADEAAGADAGTGAASDDAGATQRIARRASGRR